MDQGARPSQVHPREQQRPQQVPHFNLRRAGSLAREAGGGVNAWPAVVHYGHGVREEQHFFNAP